MKPQGVQLRETRDRSPATQNKVTQFIVLNLNTMERSLTMQFSWRSSWKGRRMNNDVIVVGAGPVGLMLAGELRLGGVEVTVLDRLAAPTGESRALGFNRRAAESLDQRGLLPRLGEVMWGRMVHFGGVRFDLDML